MQGLRDDSDPINIKHQKPLSNIIWVGTMGDNFTIVFRTLQIIDAFKTCLALNFPKLLVTSTHIAHKTWEYVLTIHKK